MAPENRRFLIDLYEQDIKRWKRLMGQHLTRWRDQLALRPACQKGVTVPVDVPELVDADSDSAQQLAETALCIIQR